MITEALLFRQVSENLPQIISLLPAVPLLGAMLFRITKGLNIKEMPKNVKSKVEKDGTTVVLVPTGEHTVLTMLTRTEEKFYIKVEDFKRDRLRSTGHGNTVITIQNPIGDIVKKHNMNAVGVKKEISHCVVGTYYVKTQDVPVDFPRPVSIAFPVRSKQEPALVE